MPELKSLQHLLTLAILLVFMSIPAVALASSDQSDNTDNGQTSSEQPGQEPASDENANDEHSSDVQVSDKQASDVQEGKLYYPSEDAMADLEATLQKANTANKLALIVFGANWCHDSKALAARMHQEPLQSVLSQNYETLLVDVGNLSRGREVIQSLGVPIYYATPTVLIVDPASRQLLNQGKRNMWGRAASISMQDSVDYFQTIAAKNQSDPVKAQPPSAEQQQLMAEIDAFEQTQAARLSEAYIITGAMLDSDFDQDTWGEVGWYRNSLANDLDQLRAEVISRIKAGETDIVLTYPVYPAWSWTTDAP